MKKLNKLYLNILCESSSYQNLPQQYKQILFDYLNDQNRFKKFIESNTTIVDQDIKQQLIDYFDQNPIDAIKSALVWKSLSLEQDKLILLDYQVMPGECNIYKITFIFYSSKNQEIFRQIYSLSGRSKVMFQKMEEKHQNINKIYNSIKKYAQKIF